MTRNLWGIVLISLATLCACTEQDQESVITNNAKHSLQFEVLVKDLTTRSSEVNPYMQDDCPDQEGLISAAQDGQLEARFKITGKTGEEEVVVRPIKYSDEGKFIADPYDLAQAGSPWELTYFTVWENDETTEKMLYSAVGSSESDFAAFVESDQVLPQNITIGEGDVFNKTTYPVTVICAVNTDAEAFGYKMWDLNFINLQSVSFMVNDCGEDGVHRVLSGKLEVYNDADTTNTVYDEGSVIKTVYFNAGVENKLFLIDHINVNNDKEFYGYKLYKHNENTGSTGDEYTLRAEGSANVTDLSNFIESDAWTYSMLDINLCDPEGTENWIFEEGGEDEELALNELYDCDNEIVYVARITVEHLCKCMTCDSNNYEKEIETYYFYNKYGFGPLSDITNIIFEDDAIIDPCANCPHCENDKESFRISYFMYNGDNNPITRTYTLEQVKALGWTTFEDYLESSERVTTTCNEIPAE